MYHNGTNGLARPTYSRFYIITFSEDIHNRYMLGFSSLIANKTNSINSRLLFKVRYT
jgi:hypothetical protein